MLKRVLFIGGDDRCIYMATMFAKRGLEVCMTLTDVALCKNLGLKYNDIRDCNFDAELVVLGLPAVNSDGMVHCKTPKASISFASLVKLLSDNTTIAGGRFSKFALDLAKENKIKIIDYSTDEVFQIENAFYTAEGAVAAIVKNTNVSLGEIKVLVTGYGRISKALSKFLKTMGADVCVYARKGEQRAWASADGLKTTDTVDNLDFFDVIVNTVPFEIINKTNLGTAKNCTLVVDLAARPGYVSPELCDECGKKLIFLPGLPAKCAPKSSGEAAGRAILRVYQINGEGM